MNKDELSHTPAVISLAIIAWNEEDAIGPMIASLAAQSLFVQSLQHGLRCEVLCLCNGCTDQTAETARKAFQQHFNQHPPLNGLECRVVEVAERGKINTWNRYVHSLAARDAKTLFFLDADIILNESTTLWNMYQALQENPSASVAVDRPIKDVEIRSRRSLRERFSASASQTTKSAEAQLSGQLYCIRAEIARNIYLPKDLTACEDGFIKALVCTDFLAHEVRSERIVLAPAASHIFVAYTAASDVLRNQKRQLIGQTIVHILVDHYLKSLPESQKAKMGETLQGFDQNDPVWLKRLIAGYLREIKWFWELVPGALTIRFRRLKRLSGWQKLSSLPAAVAGFFLSLTASWLAYRFLKSGHTGYWPDTRSPQLNQFNPMKLQTSK